MDVQSVSVELGARSYDVLIGEGLVDAAGRHIKTLLGPRRAVVVTDRNVARHHLPRLEDSLRSEGLHAGSIVLEPGEATKRFEILARLSEELLEKGVERRDLVVALGGGVIGDLAGFAASILRRGVGLVQIPTSLLSQVDSSVGGKTAINTPQGKNLVGAFHQPRLVLADVGALATLPARELRAGYAEVVKYGLIGDADFFSWLEAAGAEVLSGTLDAQVKAITRCVRMKADIVSRDETEAGDRMLLNLGHTFGHALEAWAGYGDRLLHGEAIAIGQVLAFRFSQARGLCPPGVAERVAAHFERVGLPTCIAQVPGTERPTLAQLMQLMEQDKKVAAGQLTLILAHAPGRAFIAGDVEHGDVASFLAGELSRGGPGSR